MLRLSTFLGTVLSLAAIASAQTNTLVLLADDLGVDMVEYYAEGPNPPPTPTLNKLARDGTIFRNAWSNPVCSPTRATIHTGRYSFRTGIGMQIGHSSGLGLNVAELTLPELLDSRPDLHIKHAAFGKWHMGNENLSPLDHGYSHFAGTLNNIILDLGHDYYLWPKNVNGVESISTTYATVDTVEEALAWIETAPEPWFCYVAFNAPHNPFHIPPAGTYTIVLPDVDPREFPYPFYRATVQSLDLEIGRMLRTMGTELVDRTNIIFAGDNGTPREASVAPFIPAHAKLSPYEGGINVPLIIHGPAVSTPGSEVSALVNTTDLFATIAELSGMNLAVDLPPGLKHDSVSIVPYLNDPATPSIRETVYAELFLPNHTDQHLVEWRIIRNDRYKFIVRGDAEEPNRIEFYDLQADPFETTDLLETPMSHAESQHFFALVEAMRVLQEE
jgi:arylsulfatase A-like enzyme